jgi:hypothetical protein
MFHQSPKDLKDLSISFKKELDELYRKGYHIGGTPNQTFLFKLDGSPSMYSSPPSPHFFFIKEADIMMFEDVKNKILSVDNPEFDI